MPLFTSARWEHRDREGGDFKFHGADLGILVTKGRMQTAAGLTERCRHYIDGIRAAYKSEPLPQAPPVMPIAYVK